jgi:hypothetical protein
MAHTVTVTAKTGPNRTNTALVLSPVENVTFDFLAASMRVEVAPPALPFPPVAPGTLSTGGNIKEYDLVGVTAVAVTITAGQYAVVVS